MGITVNVQDYPVREWVESDTQNGTLKLTMTVTRDDPNAATLRICIGTSCVDVDISDIPLGGSAQKTAEIECCTSAGSITAQRNTLTTCPGDTFDITAPADKARAYKLVLANPVDPPDAPTTGVVLPGKSATFQMPNVVEDCVDQEYYDLDPATVLADLTVEFKLLDSSGNEIDTASVVIQDARPFVVQAYSGTVTVDVTEVL